jgi:hypothetical protein
LHHRAAQMRLRSHIQLPGINPGLHAGDDTTLRTI